MDFKSMVQSHKDLIIQTRRDLHRIPEPAYTEQKTSAYIIDFLTKEGLTVQSGLAKYGIIGLMETAGTGKTVMIRADMDALTIEEETGLPFASTHKGVMHACGHDAHMAMVLGAVKVMNQVKEKLSGTIKFLFQPAEEGPGGAKPMIEEGAMDNPKVDYCFGCHVWPVSPEGTICVKAGPVMAAMDRFDLKIFGKGGHGAMPHLCVDSLEIATQVVNALQRVTSRQMNPLSPTVVSVCSLHAGTAFNIIPAEAELSGTTRTFDRNIWNSWHERLEKIISNVCQSMGATYELDFQQGYPPTVNDPDMSELVRKCASKVVGSDSVLEPEPTMGGEDMSYFLEKAQGCLFFLGVGRDGGAPIHNAKFDLNEEMLLNGVETYCQIIWELLG